VNSSKVFIEALDSISSDGSRLVYCKSIQFNFQIFRTTATFLNSEWKIYTREKKLTGSPFLFSYSVDILNFDGRSLCEFSLVRFLVNWNNSLQASHSLLGYFHDSFGSRHGRLGTYFWTYNFNKKIHKSKFNLLVHFSIRLYWTTYQIENWINRWNLWIMDSKMKHLVIRNICQIFPADQGEMKQYHTSPFPPSLKISIS